MRVGILPTGVAELQGLPRALESLFPGHEFVSIPRRIDGRGKPEPYSSFTSALVSPAAPPAKRSSLDRLVTAMAAHIEPGRDRSPPDLLIAIDDLELANASRPENVVAALRHAMLTYVQTLPAQYEIGFADRVRAALRERVSFHLAAPMIEAWMFADAAGPRNAGVPSERLPPCLARARDPERFLAEDPEYAADDAGQCPPWRSRAKRPEWIRERRAEHPKAYIAWLCRDPEAKKCSRYRETCSEGERCGASALAQLDWVSALQEPEHCLFLRALVEDIADALAIDNPFPGSVSPLTSRFELPADPVLRNL